MSPVLLHSEPAVQHRTGDGVAPLGVVRPSAAHTVGADLWGRGVGESEREREGRERLC